MLFRLMRTRRCRWRKGHATLRASAFAASCWRKIRSRKEFCLRRFRSPALDAADIQPMIMSPRDMLRCPSAADVAACRAPRYARCRRMICRALRAYAAYDKRRPPAVTAVAAA